MIEPVFALWSAQGKTWCRQTQAYLLGSLDEEARDLFLLALDKAIRDGATSPASALKAICQGYLR